MVCTGTKASRTFARSVTPGVAKPRAMQQKMGLTYVDISDIYCWR